jgi:hypothetical protein
MKMDPKNDMGDQFYAVVKIYILNGVQLQKTLNTSKNTPSGVQKSMKMGRFLPKMTPKLQK